MARWIFNQDNATKDYPTLGFRANPGDVLVADAAPDGRWSYAANQSLAETITRYTIGGTSGYVEPADGHVLVWSDFHNTYIPVAPSTHYSSFGGFAKIDSVDPDVLETTASGLVTPSDEDPDVLVINL